MPMMSLDSILIIDDNQETLECLGNLFSALGVPRVRATHGAEQALQILEKERFSIILSDYWMEGMDGVAMLDELRARGDQTPFLLLSGVPDTPAVIKALHHPKVAFFGKPFQLDDLTSAMEKLRVA